MKKVRFTESQSLRVLKEVEGGRHVKNVCRENGISEASYYIYGLPPFCKH
ncbi:putative transposase [Enterobacillus tribolii]|uniref:Putative transposase n=1 Tax=Enterobacillus tribolii TaxID=1487935 RepID=A0A370R506_9GAMM|nr:putative transposase [Enterobacillus tribolii]